MKTISKQFTRLFYPLGDGLYEHYNAVFSTYDNAATGCFMRDSANWWPYDCYSATQNIFGYYDTTGDIGRGYMSWYYFNNSNEALKSIS